MANIVGIRFPTAGKTYCFNAKELELSLSDRVVVESELGISIGSVARLGCETDTPEDKLRPVLRKLTAADIKQEEENEGVMKEANSFCRERIASRALPMKLITTDVTLDRKRFVFYFTADARIDFRELVKDLASKFRTRIELRQIGVRDAAKLVGGYGICGKEICCKTFLKNFAPISIKMAKQQDLVLNTCKLSGLCGRLLCCLNYEYDENAPKRRKRKPRAEEAPAPAAPAAKEAVAPAPATDNRAEQKAEDRPSAGQAAEGVAGGAAEAPSTTEEPGSERRHFKKGKRSRRPRAARKAKEGQVRQEAEPRKQAEQGTEDAQKKKKKRRRRRRKPKGGGAPQNPNTGGTGGGSGGGAPRNPGGGGGSEGGQ